MNISFIIANNAAGVYQGLSNKYSAIEPPTWALLLAEAVRNQGFTVEIVDTVAEQLSDAGLLNRLQASKPALICFVAYGQNVNAGSTSMSGVVRQSKYLKSNGLDQLISVVGSHVQALPVETLKREHSLDIVFTGEGVYPLIRLANTEVLDAKSLRDIAGIAYRDGKDVKINMGSPTVAHKDLDDVMPGYAWDLLPFKETPFDLYRSPLWHADYLEEYRSPYAAIQTSIGCQFKCSFCMINLINKNDDDVIGISSNYNGMRHWSINNVKKTLDDLISKNIRTIRITDEMFFLNKKYYKPIVSYLMELNEKDDLRLWAYSRIDTVPDPETLRDIRRAGFRWLCLGIESGNRNIRLEVAKGKFKEVDVIDVVKQIEAAGINVLANYIYGLPGDNLETIEETYKLGCELNTLGWNTYAAMALPGSPLYAEALENGVPVPSEYEEYSFHSYNSLPLPTTELEAYQVLKRRDVDFDRYFRRPEFLEKLVSKFGEDAKESVLNMLNVSLKRKIIEEAEQSIGVSPHGS